jgi:hypothetical protein
MKGPTPEELAIFASLRESIRWEHSPLDDLTETDNLFEAGPDSITFGFDKGTNLWEFYVSGYFNAARALLEGPPDKFFLVFAIYPVLFLHRHFIELKLKSLLMKISQILSTPHSDFGNDHDLLSLWKKLRQLLPTGHPAFQNEEHVERILGQFSAIDPKSMDTRYGLQRDLKTSAVSNPIEISIPILRRTMDRLYAEFNVLEAIVEDVANHQRRQGERLGGEQQNPVRRSNDAGSFVRLIRWTRRRAIAETTTCPYW